MAITVVQTKTATVGAGSSISVTLTSTTAGNSVIAAIAYFSTTAVNGAIQVTLGSAFLNGAGSDGDLSNTVASEIWYLDNIASGQTTVTASLLGSNTATTMTVYEVSGLNSAGSLDAGNVGDNDSATSPISWTSNTTATLAQASEIAVGVTAQAAAITAITGPGAFTNTPLTSGSLKSLAGQQIVSANTGLAYAGSSTHTGTANTATVIATFKAIVSGTVAGTVQPRATIPVPRRRRARGWLKFTPVSTVNAAPAALVSGTVQPRPTLPPARRKRGRGWLQFTPVKTANAAPAAPVSGTVQPLSAFPARRRKLIRGFSKGIAVPGKQAVAPAQQFRMPPRRKKSRAFVRFAPQLGANTPLHRQLLISLASKAGTDDYANAFPQGILANAGIIQGPEFIGNDFIISTAGSFFYNGTPATGNLIASIAPGDGTDSFENAYLAGVTSYVVGSGGTVFASNLFAGNVAFWAASSVSGPFTIFGNIGFSFAGTTGHIDIESTDGVGVSLNGNPLTIPQFLSGSIVTLPTDPNSGTTWVSGERAFMNNQWVTNTNNNFAAIVAALQAAGIAV